MTVRAGDTRVVEAAFPTAQTPQQVPETLRGACTARTVGGGRYLRYELDVAPALFDEHRRHAFRMWRDRFERVSRVGVAWQVDQLVRSAGDRAPYLRELELDRDADGAVDIPTALHTVVRSELSNLSRFAAEMPGTRWQLSGSELDLGPQVRRFVVEERLTMASVAGSSVVADPDSGLVLRSEGREQPLYGWRVTSEGVTADVGAETVLLTGSAATLLVALFAAPDVSVAEGEPEMAYRDEIVSLSNALDEAAAHRQPLWLIPVEVSVPSDGSRTAPRPA